MSLPPIPDSPVSVVQLGPIGQIAIPVNDVARATAFYRDALGLRFLFEFPGLAFFDAGGVRLMLSLPEGEGQDHPASVLYFRVPDIQAARDQLLGRGVRFLDEPHMVADMGTYQLWLCTFSDGEKSTYSLMSEVPSTGT